MVMVASWTILVCNTYAQQQQPQNNKQQTNYNYYYNNPYDSRYFKHGNKRNELEGGTCREFLDVNNRQQCCANRDDDCYMIHFDSRCYCDVFCDRSSFPDNSDCCPDAYYVCRNNGAPPPPPPPPPTTTTERPRRNFLILISNLFMFFNLLI